ncbi:MAG: hypothetical protein CM15mP49_12690 [Actinomycetota bacterium]|nr:MAG: hypothetical protein CM15mP49_12690 [Actinomycetota bacterium]
MENCSTKYEIHAPAKLTLSLAIKGVRQSGLHELEAEMVTIDLQDTLRLREGDIEVTIKAHTRSPSPNDDLIVQALNTVGLSMKVNVDKKIPPEEASVEDLQTQLPFSDGRISKMKRKQCT